MKSRARKSPRADQPARAPVPVDAAALDAVVRALYEAISFPPGGQPDWDRLRSLFAPGARLIPPKSDDGSPVHVLDVESFIAQASHQLQVNEPARQGFVEVEIARRTEAFGNIAHVFSTYEARQATAEPAIARGINSIQLLRDGGRWWVVTIFWDNERDDNPIPAAYLQ